MKKRKLYETVLCLLILTTLLCTACAPWKEPPDYRQRAFSAELVWESEGIAVCALLVADAALVEGDGADRAFSMTFLAPSAMEGMVLSRRGGAVEWSSDGITVDGGSFLELLSYGELLLTEGTVELLRREEMGGGSVLYGEIRGENGRVLEQYVEEKSGAPVRISDGKRSVEVRAFRFLS